MDGPGHQLFAGPALPGEEDRRLGGGHLGRPGQRRLQGRRPAEDPVEAVPLPQLLPERGEPLLQLAGAFLGQGPTLLLLGQPLVLDRHHHLGGDAGGQLDIQRVEPVGAALPEVEPASHLIAEPERNDQAGATAEVDDPPVAREGGVQLDRRVLDDHRFARLPPSA